MKAIKPLLVAALVSSAVNFITPNLQKQNSKDSSQQQIKLSRIIDFNEIMSSAILAAYKFTHPAEAASISSTTKNLQIMNLTKSNIKATVFGEPILDYNNILFNYIGHSELVNNTNIERPIFSSGFEHTVDKIISTTISYGISLDISTTIKIFDIDSKFSFNTSKSKSTETSEKFTIPPEVQIVLPHKKLTIDMYLNQLQVTQKVALDVDISGQAGATINFLDGSTVYYENSIANLIFYLQLDKECPQGISINSNDSIHFNGLAEQSKSSAGSKSTVQINGPFDI